MLLLLTMQSEMGYNVYSSNPRQNHWRYSNYTSCAVIQVLNSFLADAWAMKLAASVYVYVYYILYNNG